MSWIWMEHENIRHMIDNGIVEKWLYTRCRRCRAEFSNESRRKENSLQVCLDEADGKVPMIINVADTNVNVIKELAHHATEHGAIVCN